MIKFLNENFSLLSKENKYLSHGDLEPGNVLIKNKEILIIDWELSRMNNFAYDIAYLFVNLWNKKNSFRKELMKNFLRNLNSNELAKFKWLFQVVVFYFALRESRFKKAKENNSVFKTRRRFYLRLLENCLSFEKLIRL